MWDDLFAELAAEGAAGGSASQVRTDAAGVVRKVTYGAVPAGPIGNPESWVEVAAEGVTVEESRPVAKDDAGRKQDRDARKYRDVTGKRAEAFVRRLNGLDAAKPRKRSGKPDSVEPSANGQHTS